MSYANSACTECGELYWYGPTTSIEEEPDFGDTVGKICCPNCLSPNRRPWPNIVLTLVVHDAEGNMLRSRSLT
jgi:hypothetical protein